MYVNEFLILLFWFTIGIDAYGCQKTGTWILCTNRVLKRDLMEWRSEEITTIDFRGAMMICDTDESILDLKKWFPNLRRIRGQNSGLCR